MKTTPTSATSPDAQQALNLKLIEALGSPRREAEREAEYENELPKTLLDYWLKELMLTQEPLMA